ncbi:putative cysteine desulfurase [Roseimaritima multifibrata]|uniref:cysteine desulfurase n=1 Tax=Roseimaritima multifibrata TaxID=1930274 RepID=A0A517MEN8_9BACT|nr:SufS family cysteine desulfurase [Roseimaritima multifibrata]QDS93360.1 putative cysteine desulfurase [Roseimaritima multifibrata]
MTESPSSLSKSVLNPTLYRPDFPILGRQTNSGAPLVFLDNGASTQRPHAVIDAMSECYSKYYANVHRGIHTLSEESTDRYEQARRTVARFLNAASEVEVLFTAGTTAAINTVARTWGDQNVGPDDYILLTMMEHHANIVPWHQLSERTGCKVLFAKLNSEGQVDQEHLDSLWQQYGQQIKMFAFTAVSNVLGTITPVAAWVQQAQQHGAATLVDAAQAAPHMAIDVRQWDADFVIFSGHKLCGPTGIGVLYGRESILDAMPPFLGGGAMINTVTTEGFTTAALPDKFEAGTPPIVEAIGLEAAIDYISAVGLEAIHDHEQVLTRRAHEGLAGIEGLTILGPQDPALKGGIVSFVFPHIHAHDIAQWLDTRGIAVRAGHHCAMPLHKDLGISASSRASFYLYNTVEEVDSFVQAVSEVTQKFAPTGRKRRRRK